MRRSKDKNGMDYVGFRGVSIVLRSVLGYSCADILGFQGEDGVPFKFL